MATPAYQVTLKKDAAKALDIIPQHIAEDARDFIVSHLQYHPTQYIVGKLKRLKGRLSGIWQYDLPSGYRLRYSVDEDAHKVQVIYLGPHP